MRHNNTLFKRLAKAYKSNMRECEARYKDQGLGYNKLYFEYLHAKVLHHEYMILVYKHEKVSTKVMEQQRKVLIQHHQEKLEEALQCLRKQRVLINSEVFRSLSHVSRRA